MNLSLYITTLHSLLLWQAQNSKPQSLMGINIIQWKQNKLNYKLYHLLHKAPVTGGRGVMNM